MDDAETFLREVPLFADVLNPDQIRYLAAQSRPAFFRAGTRLMTQGDFGGAMFVIASGEVVVSFVDASSSEKAVARLRERDVVGEMSLFTGDRRTATVSAVTNVDAIEITKASLERAFARAPELVDKFAAVLAKRQAELKAASGMSTDQSRENFLQQARKAIAVIFRRPA